MSITIPGSEYTGPKSPAEEASRRERERGHIDVSVIQFIPGVGYKGYHFKSQYDLSWDLSLKQLFNIK